MEYNWRGMDRYMKEVCAADDSNLLMCGKKVKNCVTTVSSESYRASREDTDHTEGTYYTDESVCSYAWLLEE